jgi:hypothetical protein
MPLLQTGSKMSKNAVSREEAANVIDDIYRFFDLLPPRLGILIIGSQYRAQFWWFVCINFRLCVLLMQEEVRNLYW